MKKIVWVACFIFMIFLSACQNTLPKNDFVIKEIPWSKLYHFESQNMNIKFDVEFPNNTWKVLVDTWWRIFIDEWSWYIPDNSSYRYLQIFDKNNKSWSLQDELSKKFITDKNKCKIISRFGSWVYSISYTESYLEQRKEFWRLAWWIPDYEYTNVCGKYYDHRWAAMFFDISWDDNRYIYFQVWQSYDSFHNISSLK